MGQNCWDTVENFHIPFRDSNHTEIACKPRDSVQSKRLVTQNDAAVINLGVSLSSEEAIELEIIIGGFMTMLIGRTEHNPPPVGAFTDIR